MSRTLRRQRRRQPQRRPGFTLIELLVVIAIVLLVTVIAIPAINSLNGRQITDAARIFSGSLVGARDSAIKYNSPRGIRLLPDPVLTIPAPGAVGAGSTQLCYNRIIPIEPAGDYSEGRITIGPQLPIGAAFPGDTSTTSFPPLYTRGLNATDRCPFYITPSVPNVLMVEESPYVGGFATTTAQPNSPTNWFWNVRVGDKIKIGGTGRAYTIVGPCVVNPWKDNGFGLGNPELFVNVGPPGTTSQLKRRYYAQSAATPPVFTAFQDLTPEFLFLVNGEDDDLDGYTDEGWDGFNQNADFLIDGVTPNTDDLTEWEPEKWTGAIDTSNKLDYGAGLFSPSQAWIESYYTTGIRDHPYIINRRPVPSPGAREIMLPAGMVIDATTWSSTQERSRIPVAAGSLYCDIMVNPSGRYIPTTEYSSPTSASPLPFLHFWLCSRDEVFPRGSVWGTNATGVPNPNPSNTATNKFFELPLPSSALGGTSPSYVAPTTDGQYYPGSATGVPVLKGERRLVTMFNQSGLITTNPIEPLPPPNAMIPGEGFNISDVGYPFYKAQQGSREAR